ncbi:DUF3325 domain-containing protein [Stutzerimonas azotifigens]|uniref:DUF3325 domain-containing protein n=1 Tax=Stutzerimonas azotifigens TaxID=291995 RepID=UPI00041E711E|nr:DUF3325 domain-containing protein [Stutzerimonas azotifigens]
MTLLAFALAYLAMAALCLAMNRHHRQLFGDGPAPRRQAGLRLFAAAALLAAAVLDSLALGTGIGLVVWFGQFMLGALLVGLLLAWRQRWLLPVGALVAMAGSLTALV